MAFRFWTSTFLLVMPLVTVMSAACSAEDGQDVAVGGNCPVTYDYDFSDWNATGQAGAAGAPNADREADVSVTAN